MAKNNIVLDSAETDSEINACWPLMRLLRPNLVSADMFLEQVARQRRSNYRLLVATSSGGVVALAGWRVQENFIYGSFLYVDDLVTQPGSRSQGLGARLLAKLFEEGRLLGCDWLVLDTAINNIAAQRFYAREGLRNRALSFSKSLV